MKKTVLMVLLTILINCNYINGQEKKDNMNKEIPENYLPIYGVEETIIWSTIHRNHFDGTQHWETDDTFVPNPDSIRKFPISVKPIIAYFSQYNHFDKDTELILAQALGNFSTLQEARDSLLHEKEHIFKNIEIRGSYAYLDVRIEEDIMIFEAANPWGSSTGRYKFRINENGDIEYIH